MEKNNELLNFSVDLSFLERKRPVGVTGLLRVKNDAEFIELCIDSCIDALDELVIVYQKCDDNAPEIIKRKAQQYPNKIKVYFYEPQIISHNLTKEEFEAVRKMCMSSVHLLSNYYNYTLSKASYRFAVKIDADQIYFSEKLKRYCDAYRSTEYVKINIIEYFSYYWVALHNRFYKIIPLYRWMLHCRFIISNYEAYVLKMIINKKVLLNLSGVNLYYNQSGWSIPLGNGYNGIRPPFNGVGDHLFFELKPNTYYIPWEYYDKRTDRYFYYEIFKTERRKMLYGGFLWFHLDAIRKGKYKEHLERYQNNTISIGTFLKSKVTFLVNKSLLFKGMRYFYFLFFEYEKKNIPWKLLAAIKKNIDYI